MMSLAISSSVAADGGACGDLGDREAGRLGRHAGERHARVHLDDDHAAVAGLTANWTLEPLVSTPISRKFTAKRGVA